MRFEETTMRYVLLSLTTWALFGFGAAHAADPGKEVYERSCKTCHGADGRGNLKMAKMLKVEIRDLGTKEVQAKTADELKKAITKGNGKMKPVTGLTSKQLEDVVAFLRTMK